MKMTRLNVKNREVILMNWINDKRKNKIINDFATMKKSIVTIAKNQFSEQISMVEKYKDLIDSDFLQTVNNTGIHWRLCDQYLVPYHINKVLCLRDSSYRKVRINIPNMVYKGRYYCVEDHIDNIKVGKAIKCLNDKLEKIESEIMSISGILYSTSSIKKLIELIPEIKKYIPKPDVLSGQLISTSEIDRVKAILKSG